MFASFALIRPLINKLNIEYFQYEETPLENLKFSNVVFFGLGWFSQKKKILESSDIISPKH